ncbi:MAG: PIN/TRAM domain-containing protein [Candidatus Sumerlaeia bacterium]
MLKPIILARIFFVVLAAGCGFYVARLGGNAANSAIIALILAIMVVLFEYSLRSVSPKRVFLASLGLLYGLIIAALVYDTFPETIMTKNTARIVCNFLFGYLGLIIALKHADQFSLGNLRFMLPGGTGGAHSYILDTSVIIDGRVRDMIISGFMPGMVMVPTFVIDELQLLADSSDSFKRAKGRRGLTILESLQNEHPAMQILENDFPEIREVDRKLLELSKEIDAQVVTNDYNLQKVASLHKVPILNINELADMLKPSVFVGETFQIQVVREGKEENQGVGYLQDGTMVVVDDGRKHQGSEVEVVVTSLLQTNTGRMVFARLLSADSEGNGAK